MIFVTVLICNGFSLYMLQSSAMMKLLLLKWKRSRRRYCVFVDLSLSYYAVYSFASVPAFPLTPPQNYVMQPCASPVISWMTAPAEQVVSCPLVDKLQAEFQQFTDNFQHCEYLVQSYEGGLIQSPSY